MKGTGLGWFYLADSKGNLLTPNGVALNAEYEAAAGTYTVLLNGSKSEAVVVDDGRTTILRSGCLDFGAIANTYVAIDYPGGSILSQYLRYSRLDLFPGFYSVAINGTSRDSLEIVADGECLLPTGSIRVNGDGTSRFVLSDSLGKTLGTFPTSAETMVFPGKFSVDLNGSKKSGFSIAPGEKAVLPSGSLWVKGNGNGRFTFADSTGRNLTSGVAVNTQLDLLTGHYTIELQRIRKENCEIESDAELVLETGSLWMKGEGISAASLYDSAGRQLSSFLTGTQLDLFPGAYSVQVNGVRHEITIEKSAEWAEVSGVLWVKGIGGSSFSVACTSGQRIGNAPLNSQAELFPDDYVVTLNGSRSPIIHLTQGEEYTLMAGALVVHTVAAASLAIYDGADRMLGANFQTNTQIDLLPGTYNVERTPGQRDSIAVEGGATAELWLQ